MLQLADFVREVEGPQAAPHDLLQVGSGWVALFRADEREQLLQPLLVDDQLQLLPEIVHLVPNEDVGRVLLLLLLHHGKLLLPLDCPLKLVRTAGDRQDIRNLVFYCVHFLMV